MDKKKRIVIMKLEGISIRFDYTFLDDIEFQASLEELSRVYKIDKGSILTYTLGTEEETENGVVHFCPRCGTYNEHGFSPEVDTYYAIDKETEQLKPAGLYKTLNIDCLNCNDIFNISTEQFQEESAKLTKTFLAKEQEENNEKNSPI